jgi:transposase InsO family protein
MVVLSRENPRYGYRRVWALLKREGWPLNKKRLHRFISRSSDQLLEMEVFGDLLEAKVLVEDYRRHYNHHRPHSALGYQTPAEFVVATDLGSKEDAGEPKELESVLTLS